MTLDPNPRWWGDPPRLAHVVYRTLPDDAAPAAFRHNELDVLHIGRSEVFAEKVRGATDSVVRAGLAQLAATFEDVEVVGAAADGAEAVAKCLETHPDVVLMDLEMPGVDGIEATRRLAEHAPATQVVVLTSFSDRDRIVRALDAGAIGYILKDAAPNAIKEGDIKTHFGRKVAIVRYCSNE